MNVPVLLCEAAATAVPAREVRGRRRLLLGGRRQGRRLGAAGRRGGGVSRFPEAS
jgi:hypothetical protein